MLSIIIQLSDLEHAAKVRPAGFLADVKSAALCEVSGRLTFNPLTYDALCLKWGGKLTGNRGLGDVVARVAKPIARAVDRVAGTRLANCKECGRRQNRLNHIPPDPRPYPPDPI
jgi:hypothetical protein